MKAALDNMEKSNQTGGNDAEASSLPALPEKLVGGRFARPVDRRGCQSDSNNGGQAVEAKQRRLQSALPCNFRQKLQTTDYSNSTFALTALRAKMIALVWNVCCSKQFSLTTYYSAIACLDALFQKATVNVEKAELTALVLILLSAKINERKESVPSVHALLSFLSPRPRESDFRDLELDVVAGLDFGLYFETPFSLLHRLLKNYPLRSDDFRESVGQLEVLDKCALSLKQLSLFFIELCAKDFNFTQFSPNTIGLGCFVLSRACLGLSAFGPLQNKLSNEQGCEIGRFIGKCFRTLATQNLTFFSRFRKQIKSLTEEIAARFVSFDSHRAALSFFSNTENLMLTKSDITPASNELSLPNSSILEVQVSQLSESLLTNEERQAPRDEASLEAFAEKRDPEMPPT